MLRIEQLEYSYANTGDTTSTPMRFDLEVKRGEVLSVIGPSGSGKSTLLNLIAGFLPAHQGTVSVNQRFIQDLVPALRPVTLVFQEYNLFPHLDVFTNIALGIHPGLKLTAEQKAEINQALENLGLSGYEKRKPGQLSGGQRQRVAIARALVRRHEILLLDEPFAALGPAQRIEMIDLLKSLVHRHQMMALLVSHQPSDALIASERTAFIDQGKILKIESSARLLTESSDPVIRQYLGLL